MKNFYPVIFCLWFIFSLNTIIAQAPANDDMSGAILVSTIPYNDLTTNYTSANTNNATESTPDPACIASGDNNDDIWYKFVAGTKTELLRVASAVNGSIYTTFGYAMYNGGGTEMACNNQMGTFYGNEMLGGLTPGNTYYLRFWSYHNYTNMTFSFAVMDITPIVPSDERGGATPLTINAPGEKCITPEFYTTFNATPSFPDPSCDVSGDNDDDVWFQFTMPAGGVGIKVEEGTLINSGGRPNLEMEVIDDDNNGLSTCSHDVVGNITSVSGGAGHNYKLRFWTVGTSDRAVFSICLQDDDLSKFPDNNTCATATSLTVGTGDCTNPEIGNLSNSDITSSLNANPNCTVNATLRYDVWYKAVVPASGNLVVQTSATHSEVNDLVMLAYTNDCSTFTQIACDEDGNPDPFPSANHSRISLTGRTAGETILFRVMPRNATNKGQFSICAFDETPLPVQLLNFQVAKPKDNPPIITWNTATEQNTAYFSIRRSTDGVHFNEIAMVNAAGNSSSMKSYTYTDYVFPANSKFVYYTIVTVDKDGKQIKSKVKSLRNDQFTARLITSISPNPVCGSCDVNIQFNADITQKVFVQIYNSTGVLVKESTLKLTAGQNNHQLRLDNLAAGIYAIVCRLNEETDVESIVVQ